MRLFAIFFCVLFFSASAFAQVRDLFAEFDEEVKMADSVTASVSSAQEASSASNPDPSKLSSSSVPEIASSSSQVLSSSSVLNVESSSSQIAVSSSSLLELSSSSSVEASQSLATGESSSSLQEAALSSSEISAASQDSLFQDSLTSGAQAVDSALQVSSSSEISSSSATPISADTAQSSSSADISSSSSSPVVAVSSSSMSRRDILGPVKVSKVYGMDEMKGRYKSPRKALFFSLVVPGSGQLYVGGSKFNIVRGAAYLAIEAALWGNWYYYSVRKYDKQVKRYKKFAKEHFSAKDYETGLLDLYNGLDNGEEEEFIARYLSSRESYCKSIYGDAAKNKCYTGDASTELAAAENHRNYVQNDFPLYNSGSYYSNIAGASYVLGWDDVDNKTPVSALNLDGDEIVALGTSANLKTYRSMRSKANDYADMQAWFFGGLILNHVVSALDAAWSAHAHNKVLYEEELSWFDRLRFEGGFVPMNSQSVLNVYFNF